MSAFGRQYYYCPNCGKLLYGTLAMNHVDSLMCSIDCINAWEMKYAAAILGHSAEEKK